MVVQTDDRRIFDRFTARFPVKFKNSREGFGRNVFLRDICAEGAKISTKEKVLINDKIDILVEVPDGKDPVNLRGQVAWARETNPNSWEAGVQFDALRLMGTYRIFKYCQ